MQEDLKMDLSVVIRCADDPRVFECINSIDEDVDIIVSTSSNDEFEAHLREKGIRYCLSPRGNLSLTSNIGFDNAKYNKVIITDSDTLFEKQCIKHIFDELDNYKVVRAKLKFQTDKNIISSKVVSNGRDFVNSKELAFTPGLGIRKDLLNDIGNFLFNDVVPFAVDADLNNRIKNNNVPVRYLHHSAIIHGPESFRHDLKAAYRIGKGVVISSDSLFMFYHENYSKKNLRRSLKAVHSDDYFELLKQKGLSTFLYQLLWDLCFYIGSISERIVGRNIHAV